MMPEVVVGRGVLRAMVEEVSLLGKHGKHRINIVQILSFLILINGTLKQITAVEANLMPKFTSAIYTQM